MRFNGAGLARFHKWKVKCPGPLIAGRSPKERRAAPLPVFRSVASPPTPEVAPGCVTRGPTTTRTQARTPEGSALVTLRIGGMFSAVCSACGADSGRHCVFPAGLNVVDMPGREFDDETKFKPTHARSQSGRRTNACTGGRVLTPLDLPKLNLHGPRDAGRSPTDHNLLLVMQLIFNSHGRTHATPKTASCLCGARRAFHCDCRLRTGQ